MWICEVVSCLTPLPSGTGMLCMSPADARATVAKVKKINKPFARKIQILTVGEQRAKVMKKNEVAAIFRRGKESLRKARRS